ncbi:MAG: phage head closure protein [Proteobacteria bacterium]|nr:phage head closure protein [Pseudomonadota bacterium]
MVRIEAPIGSRRLRATLEESIETPDDIGGVTRSFQPRLVLWAMLIPLAAAERDEAQQQAERITHRLVIRWRGDVTGAMRFVANGRRFDVRGQYDPDGMRRSLVCLVEEVRP